MSDGYCDTCYKMTEGYGMVECAGCYNKKREGHYPKDKNGNYIIGEQMNMDRDDNLMKKLQDRNGVWKWIKV